MTINHDGEQVSEWLDLANGCICCSVKDSGVNAIESLMERRGAFDYILLETTGLADPGNIAPIFWVDDGLGSTIYLDGIVTMVDAKNILTSLDEPAPQEEVTTTDGTTSHSSSNISATHKHKHSTPRLTTAHLQISHADVVILNKTDLVSPSHLNTVKERITSINGLAKIHSTSHARVPQLQDFLLDLHAYDGMTDLSMFEAKGHSHLDPSISTITLPLRPFAPADLSQLDAWLRSVLWDGKIPSSSTPDDSRPFEIHRLKGFVPLTNRTARVVQGVREIFEIVDAQTVDQEKLGAGKLVLIGRNLADKPWERSIASMQGS